MNALQLSIRIRRGCIKAKALAAARALFGVGGRLMISPTGKLEFGLNMATIFGANVDPASRAKAHEAATTILAQIRNPASASILTCLVQDQGKYTKGGWTVLEEAE